MTARTGSPSGSARGCGSAARPATAGPVMSWTSSPRPGRLPSARASPSMCSASWRTARSGPGASRPAGAATAWSSCGRTARSTPLPRTSTVRNSGSGCGHRPVASPAVRPRSSTTATPSWAAARSPSPRDRLPHGARCHCVSIAGRENVTTKDSPLVPGFVPVYSDVVRLFSHVAGAGRRFCLTGDADLGASTLERRGVFGLHHADAGQLRHERWFTPRSGWKLSPHGPGAGPPVRALSPPAGQDARRHRCLGLDGAETRGEDLTGMEPVPKHWLAGSGTREVRWRLQGG